MSPDKDTGEIQKKERSNSRWEKTTRHNSLKAAIKFIQWFIHLRIVWFFFIYSLLLLLFFEK